MIWTPNERQKTALSLREVDILFYGGARGGGKTAYLLVDFLNGVNEYGAAWRGILFRRRLRELDEVIALGKQIYIPLGATYNKVDKRYTFPNGAELTLSFLESDSDVEVYQGHNYPWIAFDEMGNYPTDYCFNFMLMCNRSAQVPQEWVRVRATGNPGGQGHVWIKQRFIEGKEPYKVYKEVLGKNDDGEDIFLTSCFVPATVFDNTHLLKADPQYIARLMAQPERIRKAMLYGSWDVKSGGEFFEGFSSEKHVIKPQVLKGDWYRYYCMDWGYKSPYAVLKLAVNPDGMTIVYSEIYGQGFLEGKEKHNKGSEESSVQVAEKVAIDMAQEGVSECVADYNMWEQKFSELSPVDAFYQRGISMLKANKKHNIGWQCVHDILKDTDEFGTPYLRIFNTCKYLIRELEHLQCDRIRLEEPADGQADHAVDALRYGLMSPLYRKKYNSEAAVYSTPKTASYNPLKYGAWAH
ncbi:MAG: terminase family protein [Termitinemataceae bacterium]|nr:MAG: terminase family protein [Termitinemataceae bacterium]